MTPAEIQAQRELDEEILHYVRGMQAMAPVRPSAIERYIVNVRRRQVPVATMSDRLADLCDRGLLKSREAFEPGHGYALQYEVTSRARSMLDGERPWDWAERAET